MTDFFGGLPFALDAFCLVLSLVSFPLDSRFSPTSLSPDALISWFCAAAGGDDISAIASRVALTKSSTSPYSSWVLLLADCSEDPAPTAPENPRSRSRLASPRRAAAISASSSSCRLSCGSVVALLRGAVEDEGRVTRLLVMESVSSSGTS